MISEPVAGDWTDTVGSFLGYGGNDPGKDAAGSREGAESGSGHESPGKDACSGAKALISDIDAPLGPGPSFRLCSVHHTSGTSHESRVPDDA
ncbi:hypothetical protein GCM10023190_26170 [Enteractinococcus fodinae]